VATRIARRRTPWDDPNVSTRIVIVDDHSSFRSSARALLESEGFDVVGEADTGAAALEEIKRLQPDAVLLDVQLPDMDGFDVVARLGGNGSRPAIVLTSSRDSVEYGTLVADCGARGFIAKAELTGAALAALIG
jgi:DNA-binding NarL/FixJ family response regulator